MSLWSMIVAFFANLFGVRSGATAQRQVDQTAALKQEVEVDNAIAQTNPAARTNSDLAREVRDGSEF